MKRHPYPAWTILLQSLKKLHPVVTEICSVLTKYCQFLQNFKPMTLKNGALTMKMHPLLSIENIAAKFGDATPCSYRDMLQAK